MKWFVNSMLGYWILLLLISLSSGVKEGGWIYILLTPVILIAITRLMKRYAPGRMALDQFKCHVPILGKIVTKSAVARFARTFGVLLSAGVPILEAVNITRETSGNEVYARALGKVHDGIREGESIASPLATLASDL